MKDSRSPESPNFYNERRHYAIKLGKYKLEGYNPGEKNISYEGDVYINKSDTIYNLRWRIKDQLLSGTGILNGDVLSVAFTGDYDGVVSYKVISNKHLYGRWVIHGSNMLGREILTHIG